MMVNKVISIAAVLLFACLPLSAQDLSEVLFGKGNKADYMGQYNYNGKRKNGFGIERYKDGSVYIGDFVEDEISGRGMLISQDEGISKVEGAIVYVGNWRDGKKNGKGVCYDSAGNIVFKGKFVNDKPSVPSADDDGHRFVVTDVDGTVYFGEMLGDKKDGFGFTLESGGEIVYGMMEDGVRRGIGMVFYTPDLWEVGRWVDGRFSAFKNSQAANSAIEAFRASNKRVNSSMRDDLLNAAENFVQAGLTVNTMVNEIKGGVSSEVVDGVEDDGASSGVKDKSYYQEQYDRWEAKAMKTYESGARRKINMSTHGEGRIVTSEGKLLRQYQRAMKDVRKRAKKKGYIISASKYETIEF